MAALAPGLVVPVGVDEVSRLRPGEVVETAVPGGCVALDGEREIELSQDGRVVVALGEGPLVIDIDAVMAQAAADHLFNGSRLRKIEGQ